MPFSARNRSTSASISRLGTFSASLKMPASFASRAIPSLGSRSVRCSPEPDDTYPSDCSWRTSSGVSSFSPRNSIPCGTETYEARSFFKRAACSGRVSKRLSFSSGSCRRSYSSGRGREMNLRPPSTMPVKGAQPISSKP
ncbi:MAG: hypothetical protein MZV64_11555 [Ignavibacteriales bacterium]|nr:hypothetical protein [Ignavibacteriales bacterium]